MNCLTELAGGALALALALAAGSSYAATPVFVNEFHYDNVDSDTGEFIEIAGPAGTDLSGWTVVRYNGNGGGSYGVSTLSGTLADETGTGFGFTTVNFPSNGLQNGAPDGFALVDGSGAVVQFLSYEGAFVAADGDAAGLTSTDIGVFEDSSTAVGESLQLAGTGSAYEDFTWAVPAAQTPNAANNNQTFVAGVLTGPEISSSSPADGALDVPLDLATISGTFDEVPLSVSTSQWTLDCETVTGLQGAIDVTGSDFSVAVVGPLPSAETCVLTMPADSVEGADGFNNADLTIRFVTLELVAGCGDPGATPISAIQGSGILSPLVGQVHSVEAVVVGDFQATDGTGLRGFFLQEEDADADGDPATSEGIFVYDSGFGVDVAEGDLVRVTGTVFEYAGGSDQSGNKLTELGSVSDVQLCGSGYGVTPAVVALPLASDPVTDLEPVEGMAVDVIGADGDLVLAEYFNLDRFGEIRVAAGGRPEQFTVSNAPDVAGYAAHLADMARRTLLIDDGRSGQNLDPIFFGRRGFPLDVSMQPFNLLRGGDTVSVIEGVMHYDFGVYRVEPIDSPKFVTSNPRPLEAPAVEGALRVVSFNVLNYFQQLDDGTAKCGPPTNLQECRGADEGPIDSLGRTESDRQEAKLIPALLGVDADIYGLIELENDFGNGGITSAARLAELMDQANATDAVTDCSDYVAVEPGVYVGTDAIAVGLIYCADRVELAPGTSIEILDDSDLPGLGLGDWAPLFNGEATNRAALAASFRELATGERLTVSVNHFKSKGDSGIAATVCNPDPTVDPNCDQGDGAGYWNLRRTQAATALSAWLATDPTGAGDPDALVLGDLNAYAKEDPIAALEGAGYENLIARGAPGAYSYLFDAQLGYLDYALANATLAPQVTGVAEWHINADEPDALDYDISFNREQWFFEDAFRTSDHDPVVIGIDLRSPPIPGDLNGDLRVDVRDLRILLRALPSREGGVRWNPAADLNRDGIVSNRDYRIWLRYWRDFNG